MCSWEEVENYTCLCQHIFLFSTHPFDDLYLRVVDDLIRAVKNAKYFDPCSAASCLCRLVKCAGWKFDRCKGLPCAQQDGHQ